MPVAIPYVRDLDPAYGAAVKVSPLVRRVVAQNANAFTYLGTGTYLVGRGEVAVIDAGPAMPAHIDAIEAALAPGERITHLIATHTHTDHSPGLRLLQERCGAPTYGYGPHGAVAEDDPTDRVVFGDPDADSPPKPPPTIGPDGQELKEGADLDFAPDVVLRHGDLVRGAGWTLEAVHTPGHTSNHLCFGLVDERALFSGDHVMGWSTSVIGPPDGDLEAYLASLRRLLERDDAVFYPTHGPPITEPQAMVRAYLEHRLDRTRQLLVALADGPATLAQLVPRLYADVSKALWRPAAASLYAHVLAELAKGTITSDGPPRRTAVYRLAG